MHKLFGSALDLQILRCFSRRDPALHFVESPALAPPEVLIDMAAQQQ